MNCRVAQNTLQFGDVTVTFAFITDIVRDRKITLMEWVSETGPLFLLHGVDLQGKHG
jgi:hypothetical protein